MTITTNEGDQRRYPRLEGSLPMQYQVSTDGQWIQGQGHIEVVDVGMGGIRIRIDEPVEAQSQLYLHVPLPDGPVYAMARVAWVTAHNEGGHLAGIEFVDVAEADRARLVEAARG